MPGLRTGLAYTTKPLHTPFVTFLVWMKAGSKLRPPHASADRPLQSVCGQFLSRFADMPTVRRSDYKNLHVLEAHAGLANYTSLPSFMASYGSISELREFNLKKEKKKHSSQKWCNLTN